MTSLRPSPYTHTKANTIYQIHLNAFSYTVSVTVPVNLGITWGGGGRGKKILPPHYFFVPKNNFLATLPNFCVVLCIVCFVSFSVLFVCRCVLYYCHRVATKLQLTNIS